MYLCWLAYEHRWVGRERGRGRGRGGSKGRGRERERGGEGEGDGEGKGEGRREGEGEGELGVLFTYKWWVSTRRKRAGLFVCKQIFI